MVKVVDLSLVHRSCVCSTRRWCVVGVSLVCRWCVCLCASGPSLSYSCSWSLVRRSSVWSSITGASVRVRFACRWSVTRLSHESLTGLSVRVVVTGLFVRRWCVVGLLLVRLFVSRLQLVCCSSNADLSVRVMVASPAALFAPGPSDRPSLLCVFVRCLSGTSPSLVRVVDPSLVFLLESSLSYRCLVARPLGSTRLHSAPLGSTRLHWALCSLRFGCSVLHSTALLLHSTRPAFRFLFCWLRLAATLFTHTLSHAWCPVTLLSLTCCSYGCSPSSVVVVGSVVIAASRVFRHEGC